MTDLWTRFQSAVRWLVEGSTAGVRTISGSPVAAMVEVVSTSVATAAPAAIDDGIDVRGVRTLDMAAEFEIAGESATVRIYVFNGVWYAAAEDLTITAQAGETTAFLNPFDCESWQRVYVRIITAPTSGAVTLRACPEAG
jgi:hypothetical protein